MSEEASVVRRASRTGMALGIVVLLLGMLAIALPLVSGLAVTAVVAAVLVIGGVCQTIFAFGAHSLGRGLLAFLFGAITAVAGVIVFANPVLGLATLTVLIIAYFLVDGVYNAIAYFRLPSMEGRGWLLVGAIASIVLALLVWVEFPSSAEWALGLLVGIRLIMTGWTMIVLHGAAHRLARDAAQGG